MVMTMINASDVKYIKQKRTESVTLGELFTGTYRARINRIGLYCFLGGFALFFFAPSVGVALPTALIVVGMSICVLGGK